MIEIRAAIKEFLDIQNIYDRKVVIVTSGGTLVPLEKNAVRFIDNFSHGTRGSASAEQFVKKGCAVIFLYRLGSLIPWHRRIFPENQVEQLNKLSNQEDQVVLRSNKIDAFFEYKYAKDNNLIHFINFVELDEYMALLKELAMETRKFGKKCMFYLSAAVSDFYLPSESLPEHKIQSAEALKLELSQVPKNLGVLKREWASEAIVVSFKLETSADCLLEKSKASLKQYYHDAVIGNVLNTRKDMVILITRNSDISQVIERNEFEIINNIEIEGKIVEQVLTLF